MWDTGLNELPGNSDPELHAWAAAALEPLQQDIDSLATLARLLHQRLADAENTIQHLHIALTTSRHIGMAQGIIMARLAVSEEEAFQTLVQASQNSHRKLRDIAEDVIYTGQLPDPPG
jgi:AmiR/NasT family two-component response regulator